MFINENTLEQAIIRELQEKGYEYCYGPDIERDDERREILLEDCLASSLMNINPEIDELKIKETIKTVKNLGLVKLEDRNALFHKMLVEGVDYF